MALQVGSEYIVGCDPKSRKQITYADTGCDDDGWVDANKFVPVDFDLVLVRTDKDKTKPGWYCGQRWDGRRISSDEKILFWKRQMDAV